MRVNSVAAAAVLAVLLASEPSGCVQTAKEFIANLVGKSRVLCDKEQKAHEKYVTIIGPFRTADQRAREQRFYERVMRLCAIGAPADQVEVEAAAADAARK